MRGSRDRWGMSATALAVVLASSTSAADASDAFNKGPYLQNVSRSSVTVMWESTRDVPGRVTLHGVQDRVFESEAVEVHEVVIDGLEPGRRYQYTVDCEGEQVRGEFATAPEPTSPFQFVVFGDSRSNAGSHRNVIERVRREVPDFLLGTGDMVNEGGSDGDWQLFFDVEAPLLRENVLFPSLGNHDRQGRGRTADNYRKYFALPENSPDPERYYAFTYANARFLILDSNAHSFALTDQTAWIEQQLQAARLDDQMAHIFVSMHHPPYSTALHGGQQELRAAWTPLFEKYGVAAVFSGHDHAYERSERGGVRYFVSGGGGAPLYGRSRKPSSVDVAASRYFERTNHYLRVTVAGSHIEVTGVRVDGTIIESVQWGERSVIPNAMATLQASAATPPEPTQSQQITATGGTHSSARIAQARTDTSAGFGPRGLAGAAIALLAGAILIWAWRWT